MTIGGTTSASNREVVPEGKRLRMKDWLESRIGDPRYPGFVWLDEEKKMFRIPWKHAALHGWNQNSDGALFRDWAKHTGACIRNAHPKQLKATFRCALNSLPDVHEERSQAKKRGDEACRVFRFDASCLTTHKRRHIRIRNHKEKEGAPKQNKSKRQRVGPANRVPTQFSDVTCLNWSSPALQEPFAVNLNSDGNNNHLPFSVAGKDASRGYHNSPQQRLWATSSESDYSQDLHKTPAINLQNSDASYFHWDATMQQQSTFAPGFSPTYFSEAQNVYDNATAQGVEGMYGTNGNFPFPSDVNEQASSFIPAPLSPGNLGYSSSCATVTLTPPMSSPHMHGIDCVNGSPVPAHSPTTRTGIVASCADFQSPVDFTDTQQLGGASPFYGEKALTSMDAMAACGTTQQVIACSAENMAYTTPTNAASSEATVVSKDFNQMQTYFGSRLHEICEPPLRLGESQTLPSATPSLSARQYPQCGREFVGVLPSSVGQYTTETLATEEQTQEWIPSPQHGSPLPSACTLLSPDHSPATKRPSSLQWISVSGGDETATHAVNYESLQRCDPFQDNVCVSDIYRAIDCITALPVSTTHQSSPMYAGYASY